LNSSLKKNLFNKEIIEFPTLIFFQNSHFNPEKFVFINQSQINDLVPLIEKEITLELEKQSEKKENNY
jgi:hypothetical protein